ncbi:MAG TPA: arylsulfatase [Acidimicrobiales bacterium]|nr:arylsulfatase [Acidimicrobiales bacterium]
MPTEEPFQGVIGRTLEDSVPWWPPLPEAPEGAPNVVVVLLDDVGYAQIGCYGSDIATPNFDRLAAGGLRYSNFHTTALCSPTRAALLTGRNHHTNGMGRIVEIASGFPGYDAVVPKSSGFLSEILLRAGYSTFLTGKWHLAPAGEMTMGSPRDKWPLGRGFERFYGFLGGETDQYHPDLVHDNHQVDPPRTPEEGYHLTEDLVDHAIAYITDVRAVSPEKPFLLWYAPGACHAPHQAPAEYIDRYRGRFDQGWDQWRHEVFERQVASGLLPPGTRLSDRPHWVAPWDSLSGDERTLYARMMEVYAGFLEHTDAQLGRLLDFIETLGETDNTLVLAMSDNGASAEGGPRGSFNEMYFFNFEPERLEENLQRMDLLGGPRAHNHYPWGWAWAGNTPLKRWKRETHEGGVCDPLIVNWPARISARGETRHQYVHAVDVLPTVLELIGLDRPDEINGVPQRPLEGVSFAATLDDPSAPSAHVTQYYEMLGSRALYHDGWKAVVFHPMAGLPYDGSDPNKPFDEDDWELYHVAEDFSETRDLASEQPAKLEEMIELWWSEAERFNVLPLTNQPGRGGDRRYRRDRYQYGPGIGSLPEIVAPNLRNRPWRMQAELLVGPAGADGVIAAHGGSGGGYAIYVRDGRLVFTYNFLGTTVTTVTAEVALPPGEVTARIEFVPTGPFQGDLDLYYGDVPVGQGHLPRTTLFTYGMQGFTVGYQRGSGVVAGLEGRCTMPEGSLRRVVFEAQGRRVQNPEAQERAGLAMQ